VTLRIRQYAYFAVWSERMPAEEMAVRIGLEPDKVLVRGSRRETPQPIPVAHQWAIECRDPDLDVGDQTLVLLTRLRPHEEAIRRLAEDLHRDEGDRAGPQLSFVRYLDDPQGTPDGWQHRLLGWNLSAEALRFLTAVHANLDADEYGQDLPWWRFRLRRQYARIEEGTVIIDAETGVQVAGPPQPSD
jgi:hypothetical protein